MLKSFEHRKKNRIDDGIGVHTNGGFLYLQHIILKHKLIYIYTSRHKKITPFRLTVSFLKRQFKLCGVISFSIYPGTHMTHTKMINPHSVKFKISISEVRQKSNFPTFSVWRKKKIGASVPTSQFIQPPDNFKTMFMSRIPTCAHPCAPIRFSENSHPFAPIRTHANVCQTLAPIASSPHQRKP